MTRRPDFLWPLLLFTASALLAAEDAGLVDPEKGVLHVFVDSQASGVLDSFGQEVLPKLEKLAADMGAPILVHDVRDGAPPAVTITPTIVFENYRGRSIYQGRYRNLQRIKTFVRTSRFAPQAGKPREVRDLPVWQTERASLIAPIKVSDISGSQPIGYRASKFQAEARKAIEKGLTRFRTQKAFSAGLSDRLFYMDFYPWLAEDGTLFLSTALFSQFHCKKPIFVTGDAPFVGPWKQRKKLFQAAAAQLEQQVMAALVDPALGDGFQAVEADLPEVGWGAISRPMPAPSDRAGLGEPPALAEEWEIMKREDLPPQVQFAFPEPLGAYRGEVPGVSGQLSLPGTKINGGSGRIEVAVHSLTMGSEDLDDALRSDAYLDADRYPTSWFEIESLQAEEPLAFGQLVRVHMRGRFSMKGQESEMALPAFLEAVILDDERAGVVLTTSFDLNLDDYSIDGADGPAPARHTLNFDIRAVFAAR